jgi:flagellar FliJ protein
MKRSDRLKAVCEVVGRNADAAARCMAESQAKLQQQQSRLRQLTAYREEYQGQFSSSAGQGLDAVRLQGYRQFLAKVNDAMAQQNAIVQACAAEHEESKAAWLALSRKAKAVDKVLERCLRQQQLTRDQREQQVMDEYALRRHNSDSY